MITKDIKGQTKLFQESAKYKYYCKCGHSVVIYPFEHRKRKICSWCGMYVYVDKKEEFKDKMKGVLK